MLDSPFHNLSPLVSRFSLVYLLAWNPLFHTPYVSSVFTQSLSSFRNTCPYHCSLFCCSNKIMSSIPSLSHLITGKSHDHPLIITNTNIKAKFQEQHFFNCLLNSRIRLNELACVTLKNWHMRTECRSLRTCMAYLPCVLSSVYEGY